MPTTTTRAVRLLAALGLLLLAAPAATAQNFRFQVGGGLATQYGAAHSVGAYKIGAGYEYEFDQHWTFAPALLFVGKGWQDPDRDVPDLGADGQPRYDDAGRLIVSRKNRSVSANYIELPLLFHYYYRLGESRYAVFAAGPYAALGVAGKVKTKGDGERSGSEKIYYDEKTFGHGGLRRFDAGLSAFAGYQFPSGLTLGVEANFGLIPTTAGGGRNLAGLVSLSYTLGRD